MKVESTPSDTAIVLLGGAAVTPVDIGPLPETALVVTADSGAHHADALGLSVHVLIGDMDSIDETALAALGALGATVIGHPSDKNETDAELALLHSARCGARKVVVVSSGGGRLDHQLSLFSLLFHDSLRGIDVEARIGASRSYPVRSGESRIFSCRDGDIVGLLPFGGDSHGIVTDGLQWPLHGESLRVAASRGVSNRAVGERFSVSVGNGRLLVTVDRPEASNQRVPK